MWVSRWRLVREGCNRVVKATTNYLMQHGMSSVDAGRAAYGLAYQELLRQSSFLGFMDCFRVIGLLTLATVPLVFFVKKFAGGGQVPEGGR